MVWVASLLACLALPLATADAPTCPPGWTLLPTVGAGVVIGTCYYESDYESNWVSAKRTCEQFVHPEDPTIKGALASVHSLYENAFIFDNVTNSRNAWLGLNQRQNVGDWVWDDDTRVNFEFWLAGYPKADDGLDCVSQASPLQSRCGEWVNADCTTNVHFACEMAAKTA
ncbi:lectin BRA-3-like [Pollicipes pollicipes]|uniref:lectin BRA-3-like n=1 Tax=Pollicipes pollicipes TaxID=41117 RepID=UPI0018855959|nr:lectin BRA-3-like [Pollicipes pollicipes]